jgi:hypothetical protein
MVLNIIQNIPSRLKRTNSSNNNSRSATPIPNQRQDTMAAFSKDTGLLLKVVILKVCDSSRHPVVGS